MPGFVIRIRPSSWHVFITNHSSHPEYVSNWVKGWLGCIIQYVEAEQITPWPITSALTEATYPKPLSSVPPLRSHSSSVVIRVVYAIDEGVSGCHGVDARISNSPSRLSLVEGENWEDCDVNAPSDRGDTMSPGPGSVSACPRLITANAPTDCPCHFLGRWPSLKFTRPAKGARVWAIFEPLGWSGPISGRSRIQASAP